MKKQYINQSEGVAEVQLKEQLMANDHFISDWDQNATVTLSKIRQRISRAQPLRFLGN